MDFSESKDIKILKFDLWDLYLHPHQNYLGRCYLWAKRPELIDFMDMNEEEWAAFKTLAPQIKNVLKEAFNADHFNYSSLGNITRHLHIHFIPRYQSPRILESITFSDSRWGNDYDPYDRTFTVPKMTLSKIAETISDHAQKNDVIQSYLIK